MALHDEIPDGADDITFRWQRAKWIGIGLANIALSTAIVGGLGAQVANGQAKAPPIAFLILIGAFMAFMIVGAIWIIIGAVREKVVIGSERIIVQGAFQTRTARFDEVRVVRWVVNGVKLRTASRTVSVNLMLLRAADRVTMQELLRERLAHAEQEDRRPPPRDPKAVRRPRRLMGALFILLAVPFGAGAAVLRRPGLAVLAVVNVVYGVALLRMTPRPDDQNRDSANNR